MKNKLDKNTAIRILHSLAESGQPPKLGAYHLNQGTDAILRRLSSDYLDGILRSYEGRDGAGVCKWVVANYGNGKTQFLRCLEEQAWELNYTTAFVELSQNECPLDRPDLVYKAVARAIQAKPLSFNDVDRGRGLDVALAQLLDRMFNGLLTKSIEPDLKIQAIAWVETSLASTPVESSSFKKAVEMFLLSTIQGDSNSAKIAAAYLRGEAVSTFDFKSIGLYEKLDKSNGFLFLRSLCQLLQRTELASGTVLLFDEARRSLSLMSTRTQKIACENLLSVINRCNSEELPGTMFVYAVMPEFFTDFATAYPALQQRCGPNTRINLEELHGIQEEELLRRIGLKIVDVFTAAYGETTFAPNILENNLSITARETLRQTLVGSGIRRLFVKTWTNILMQARELGMPLLNADDLQALFAGAKSQLDSAEQVAVNAEGE